MITNSQTTAAASIYAQDGFLGTGNIARQFSQDLESAQRVQLKAVGSRRRQTAEAFSSDFGIARVYDNYDAVLADDQLDAVYVSLPNSMHKPPWKQRSAFILSSEIDSMRSSEL